MSEQLGLILRDQAIEHVRSAASEWCADMVSRIALIEAGREFSTDDLWSIDGIERVHERRAMGAAVRTAAALGLIEAAGRYVKSTRAECHCRPVAVWRRR